MKKVILFSTVALFVGMLSAFNPKLNSICWYREGGTDKSGPTDQASCSVTLTVNCTITDDLGVVHSPVYASQASVGDPAHICKYGI